MMNFAEIPEDQVLGDDDHVAENSKWLQKFDSHIQEIMLQKSGMSNISKSTAGSPPPVFFIVLVR